MAAGVVRVNGFNFNVERWSDDNLHCEETIAICARMVHAQLIFEALVKENPKDRYLLRNGAHVIIKHPVDESRPISGNNVVAFKPQGRGDRADEATDVRPYKSIDEMPERGKASIRALFDQGYTVEQLTGLFGIKVEMVMQILRAAPELRTPGRDT